MTEFDDQNPSATAPPAPAEPQPASQRRQGTTNRDLSAEIEQAVPRELHDRVKCVRLYDDFYRVNWWGVGDDASVGGRASWTDHATSRVRKSRFLCVTLENGKLNISERDSAPPTEAKG